MGNTRLINFFGSLLVIAIAISIFLMLMAYEMPTTNRELLISFVSVLFGAMASSLKNVTGDESSLISELQRKNTNLEDEIKLLMKQINNLTSNATVVQAGDKESNKPTDTFDPY